MDEPRETRDRAPGSPAPGSVGPSSLEPASLEPASLGPGSPALRAAFWVYKRVVSPGLHAFGFTQCRYLPTCSEYAYVALARFGIVKGTGLAIWRLLRCHPWAKGGLDPVPEQ